jgi:flagellar hook-associated protein 1 FlgK
MITPGFFGYYNANRGLMAAQNALSIINQNISNVNTAGYSRQRVDLVAADAYTMPSTTQVAGGQIGQGPIVQQVTRIRDLFLDAQYRLANGKLGSNSAINSALQQIQGVIKEPSTDGVSATLQNFFNAAQAMSQNPETAATRSSFVQQAINMVTVFQQQAQQLADLRKNLVGDPLTPGSFTTSQMAINVNDINNKLAAIANLSRNIVSVQASGAQPNDLMDQRDKLLDELSKLVDIQVTDHNNGQIDVSMAGQTMIRGVQQMDSLQVVQNTNAAAPLPDDIPAFIQTVNGAVILNDGSAPDLGSGTLKGISDMGGNDPALSTVRGMMGQLDNLLNTIVTQLNTLQNGGRDQNGNLGPPALFLTDPTLNPGQTLSIFHWTVNSVIVTDPVQVAAAIDDGSSATGFAGSGDGRNALAMAQIKTQAFASLGNANVMDYFNGVVSKLGIDAQSYENTTKSQSSQVNTMETARQAVSGVDIDSETIDLMRYQRAFEATSKVLKTLDEVMQNIINLIV